MVSALTFARKGDTVYASMRNLRKSGALDTAVRAEGLKIELVQLDVTDEQSVQSAVANILRQTGRIDVLVNNAGIDAHGPIEETDDSELREIFGTNFFGALCVIRHVVPGMRQQRSGTIVNVSSLAGRVPLPFAGAYSASKFALEGATEALHFELHPFGVRVVLIEPGSFETNIEQNRRVINRFNERSPYAEVERRFSQAMSRLSPSNVGGNPQDVADVIYTAVNDKAPKLRYAAGEDAKTILGLKKQLDDSQFERQMREILDFWD
jgi:NAD(P)-dependent dehydrogenase (short-subunit alcohol dehydrogenase family)